MPKNWQLKITELFKSETGENYSENTFRMLNIPEWYGNKILIDTSLYPLPESLMGIIWSKPLMENRIRIVSLVIDKKAQNNSHGTMILDDIIGHSKSEGKTIIQLEVRKSNIKAQKFYSRHGLKIEKTLSNYYSNEDGLLMVGEL
ncbi:MAG: GNAT family N-acetyltransferase [Candidatus Poseidoniaceae archaeon]|nr:GNAT family N-acetyltransferase [Candidatus Poseidoniaceae archaeon]